MASRKRFFNKYRFHRYSYFDWKWDKWKLGLNSAEPSCHINRPRPPRDQSFRRLGFLCHIHFFGYQYIYFHSVSTSVLISDTTSVCRMTISQEPLIFKRDLSFTLFAREDWKLPTDRHPRRRQGRWTLVQSRSSTWSWTVGRICFRFFMHLGDASGEVRSFPALEWRLRNCKLLLLAICGFLSMFWSHLLHGDEAYFNVVPKYFSKGVAWRSTLHHFSALVLCPPRRVFY